MKIMYQRQCTVTILFLVLLAKYVHAVNVGIKRETTSYIFSPVLKKFGVDFSKPIPDSLMTTFYGYHLNLYTETNGNASMTIGAPKMIDSDQPRLQNSSTKTDLQPKGNILSCQKNSPANQNVAFNCSPTHSSNSLAGDNFGMIAGASSVGTSMACSVTREHQCGNFTSFPGVCFKYRNLSWEEDDRTLSIRCPGNIVDVLFVLDGSASVGNDSFKIVKQWVKNITQKLDIDKGKVAVGVVQYSQYWEIEDINNQSWIVTHIKIGKYKSYEKFANAVDKIKLHGYTTYTGKALKKVVYDFQNAFHYNESTTKQIMILLTDGKATDVEDVAKNAQKLRDIGVISYAVGVGEHTNTTELNIIATGNPLGNNTRVFRADNFSGLDVIAKELETTISDIVLEGAGIGKNITANKMEFGAMGISITYSKIEYPTINSSATTKTNKVVYPNPKLNFVGLDPQMDCATAVQFISDLCSTKYAQAKYC